MFLLIFIFISLDFLCDSIELNWESHVFPEATLLRIIWHIPYLHDITIYNILKMAQGVEGAPD